VKKIRDKFHGKIRWIFKDFPLDRHKHARYLAQAARCAADQDRFWDFQDLMYGLDKDPDPNLMKQEAESLGLDSVRFSDCLESGKKLSFVEKDKQEGKEAGVSSTPTFVINGRLRPGYITFEMFSDLIQGELEKGL
jgi:protein-disulfide isomerase